MTAVAHETISVPRAELLAALARVSTVASRGGSKVLPITAAVRITGEANGLRFTATDFDRTVTTLIAVDGCEDFPPRAIPCVRLASIVAQLPPAAVSIVPIKSGIRLAASGAKAELVGLPVDDFPTADVKVPSADVSVDTPGFLAALVGVAPFCSTAQSRPTINGVHVVAKENGDIVLEATDGLAMAREAVPRSKGPALDIIIPAPSCAALAKLFTGSDRLAVGLDGTQAVFSADVHGDAVAMETRLIQGPFPETSHVLNQALPHTAVVDRVALLAAVKRVCALSASPKLAVRLEWTRELVTVRAVGDEETGTSEDAVLCSFDGSAPLAICFAPQSLGEILGLRKGASVRLALKSPTTAMSVRDDGSPVVQNLLMPRKDYWS